MTNYSKNKFFFVIKKSYHILNKNFRLTFWLEHNKMMHDACFFLVAFYSCCHKQVMSRVNNIISSIVYVLRFKKFLDKPVTCKRISYKRRQNELNMWILIWCCFITQLTIQIDLNVVEVEKRCVYVRIGIECQIQISNWNRFRPQKGIRG